MSVASFVGALNDASKPALRNRATMMGAKFSKKPGGVRMTIENRSPSLDQKPSESFAYPLDFMICSVLLGSVVPIGYCCCRSFTASKNGSIGVYAGNGISVSVD